MGDFLDRRTVEGNKAVGMTPVLYMNERNTYDEIPKDTIVIEDLLKLLDYTQSFRLLPI